MTVPKEYNVAGGMKGLGQDILLEVLTEIEDVTKAQQFIGVCKMTCNLKDHDRFNKIMEILNSTNPGTLAPLKSTVLQDVGVQGDSYIHAQINDNHSTILFDPAIKIGIVRIEILNVKELIAVGIADESLRYERN
ncbi:MAG: hypothetical protein EZS28_049336, partial [Streblomastix strix]